MMPCDPLQPNSTASLRRLWYRVSDTYRNVARRIRKALHRCNAPVVTITHAVDCGIASEYDTYCSRCFRHLEEFSYGATRDGEFVVADIAEVRVKSLELQTARDVLRVDTFDCEDFTDLRDQIAMLRKQAGMPVERAPHGIPPERFVTLKSPFRPNDLPESIAASLQRGRERCKQFDDLHEALDSFDANTRTRR